MTKFKNEFLNDRNQRKERILLNYITIVVLKHSIVFVCKSSTKRSTKYEGQIPYGTYGSEINIKQIKERASCSCKSERICKHIIGCLFLCRDEFATDINECNLNEFTIPKTKIENQKNDIRVYKKISSKKRKIHDVIAEYDDPVSRKRKCLMRNSAFEWDTNLTEEYVDTLDEYKQKALKYNRNLVLAARTNCARRIYINGNCALATK